MASDHNSPRSRRHTVESGLRKKKDITDPNFKTKEEKLKDKKANLKNKDGVRSKVLDARIKRTKKKHSKAMEKAKKYAQVEVSPSTSSSKEKQKEEKAYKKYKEAKKSGDGDKASKKYDKLVKRQVKSINKDVKVDYSALEKRPKKGDENYVSRKEIREAKRKAKENESYVPDTSTTNTVVVNAKENKRKRNKRIKDDYSVSVNEEGKSDNPAQSRHIKVALKKGSVHYKTGPIQYQTKSNLRMDDMVSTVGPLQGSDGESTVTQVSPMGKKANIVHKMASKRNMLKKMDAMHNGEPGVQKEDFEQFKNK